MKTSVSRIRPVQQLNEVNAVLNEIDLQFRILDWIHFCVDNSRFNIEVPFLSDEGKVRRIDFIQNNPRNVVAYELKRDKVSISDVTEAISQREYMKLLQSYFNRPVKFVFLSLHQSDPGLLSLLDQMPTIKFKRIQDLAHEYYVRGLKKKWKYNVIHLNNKVSHDRFKCLFDESLIRTVQNSKVIQMKMK